MRPNNLVKEERGKQVMKIRIKISSERETLVAIFENDTAFKVAERCLNSEFGSNPPRDLINELAVIIQM